MNIAIIGYGKMGRAIEQVAINRDHKIPLIIDWNNRQDLDAGNLSKVDVAIEFTGPESAFENVMRCLELKTPVVCGSTGWLQHIEKAKEACLRHQSALLYASNFSVGVNIFFALNKKLAELMSQQPGYNVSLTEIHHTQKKDAPSGTAISLAEQIMERILNKKKWVNQASKDPGELQIISQRVDPAPGTHTVNYDSTVDSIEIKHTAHSRMGFAEGAVLAAEYIHGKKGMFTMSDVLGI